MKDRYLEVTYRHGRFFSAYYYLPRKSDQKSHRTVEMQPGILVDFSRGGRPIGIEITSVQGVSVARMNRILRDLGQPALNPGDLAPLLAA